MPSTFHKNLIFPLFISRMEIRICGINNMQHPLITIIMPMPTLTTVFPTDKWSAEYPPSYQHSNTWKTVPGCRHGKLFIGRPCKTRADDLLKLGKHQLKMAVAILTGNAPVREHQRIMGLFSGDPSCRFCKMETETVQHITCCCEALARQRYNIFGKLFAKPKDISTASIKYLCLFIRDTGILNLCWIIV